MLICSCSYCNIRPRKKKLPPMHGAVTTRTSEPSGRECGAREVAGTSGGCDNGGRGERGGSIGDDAANLDVGGSSGGGGGGSGGGKSYGIDIVRKSNAAVDGVKSLVRDIFNDDSAHHSGTQHCGGNDRKCGGTESTSNVTTGAMSDDGGGRAHDINATYPALSTGVLPIDPAAAAAAVAKGGVASSNPQSQSEPPLPANGNPAAPADDAVDRGRLYCPASLLPRCRAARCKSVARPNILLFNDLHFNDAKAQKQSNAFASWVESVVRARQKLVVLEIGVGTAVPTVRATTERVALDALSDGCAVSIVRINTAPPPRGAEGGPIRTVHLQQQAAHALPKLAAAVAAVAAVAAAHTGN